ncbi:uncharacterized protein ARB_07641 [Trichophyton benhamiae CBS 112371]|uniref:Uncharacterized protein n=1 Tax=Arthroderma benhamiae (strain ATCC MYA-4681 / CBS 112371) TaxID=663331 RepID=D4ATS5_ARTBC|nr:uncharacterized protein ARB_07641 [Trichophyton benhamiae CBS 112371]EFE33694.1 hypothetical protein ARB_07641 [Trichophyton benhamiae CBS 112371]
MAEAVAPDRFLAHGPKQQPSQKMIHTIAGPPSRAIPSKLREMSAGHAAPGFAPVLLSAIFLLLLLLAVASVIAVAVTVVVAVIVAGVVAAEDEGERKRKRKIQCALSSSPKGDAFGRRGFCCHSPPSPPP